MPLSSIQTQMEERKAIHNVSDSLAPTTSATRIYDNSTVNSEISGVCYGYDIGNFIGKMLDDFTKEQLILNHWRPPRDYIFPCSVVKKKTEKKVTGDLLTICLTNLNG